MLTIVAGNPQATLIAHTNDPFVGVARNTLYLRAVAEEEIFRPTHSPGLMATFLRFRSMVLSEIHIAEGYEIFLGKLACVRL
jgi:hypothetical protein